ncbi:multidrug resistance efflux transporter family protein [Alicyclobacillus fastidiosus]|uniref:Multidrug resistance efflux transporter family protein n=1 Tax=Alicyclobacillus fastidiosus TaxID=392011 RepID=A0ABY6ZAT2_9BACL|nr:multidrug resistance efflux transporter family protein [Alicyclobacillus fastidiosus]WAH39939.1 multidrug resistance efflux transporter family protein [Alicyclobacillus fastidiosus]
MKAIILGILASFFFAVTFVLNKLMSDAGGSWIWSASLRYLFMLPLLLIIVCARRRFVPLLKEMGRRPWRWAWWSFIGFGLFYAPLCFAAAFSPAWLVAGTWQFTIIAGSLLVPLFHETIQTNDGVAQVRKRIPLRNMGMSFVILSGIVLMEWSQATDVSVRDMLFGMIPILVATFAYPLGNRKMMELCAGRVDAYERTLGMTIASLPLWLILSSYQLVTRGFPSVDQTLQSSIVAVFSGVIATVLFFTATDMARHNVNQLATVEATQSGEVVFTLLGEMLLISGTKISLAGLVGLVLVVVGMVLHSFMASIKRPSDCADVAGGV